MKQTTLAITIGLLLGAQGVAANPSGPQVIHGSATFSSPSADVLNVHNSNNAIINWQSFSIGQGQTTNFIQPSAASSVLNRVISNNPSQLLGTLNSNGNVYLINQHGILVGQDAQINTAGFFGSTLNITDKDYLDGNLKFEGGGIGGIDNQGYIHAGDNGHIVLIAPDIENGGVIEVDGGNVILAAGKSITITSLQNSAIQFEVTGSENSVTNLGQIIANNGAASLFANTLQHSGAIRASGLVRDADGTIRLVATDRNTVSGEVDVTGETGGRIEVLGDVVSIENGANVDASGAQGGGEILVGGDQQGLNPDVMNATSTTVAAGAKVRADGVGDGNGGRVIVFAENDVHVHGEVTARGGESGGDGGFIETSGLRVLDITSIPDASAAYGTAGQWLIDPFDITILPGSGTHDPSDQYAQPFTSVVQTTFLGSSLISAALSAGTSVEISTGVGVGGNGDINLLSSATAGALTIDSTSATDVTLTLNAHNDIVVDTDNVGGITIGASGTGALNVVFNADSESDGNGSVQFNTGAIQTFPITIDTNGGAFTTSTDVSVGGIGSSVTINGDWTIPQLTTLTVDQNLVINSPNAVLQNFGEIIVGSSSSAFGVSLNISGDTLNLLPGSILSGFGSLIGNVGVNGGAVFGGAGTGVSASISPGTLDVQGNFTMNSGLLYSVVSSEGSLFSSTINVDAGLVRINGGTAMMAWGNSQALSDAQTIGSTGSIDLFTCLSVTCIDDTSPGFDTFIGPLTSVANSSGATITTGLVSFDYVIDPAANVVTWTGSAGDGLWSSAGNWSTSAIPTASDYVFIHSATGSEKITLSAGESAAGVQSFEEIQLIDGVAPSSGILSVDGDIFILDDAGLTDGQLFLTGANSGIQGTGGLYIGPGAGFIITQGSLTKDVVNWSGIKTTAGNTFQLDANLANFSLFLLDDSAGTNRISGTGVLDNHGVLDFGVNGSLDLLGSVTLTSASAQASFIGSDVLQLNDTSTFDVQVAPNVYQTSIGLELQGGTLANAQNLPTAPATINWFSGTISGASGGDFNLSSGAVMNLLGTGDMIFTGGLNLNNNGIIDFQSAGGDFIFNTGILTNANQIRLNHTSANAGFSGSGTLNNLGVIGLQSTNNFSLGIVTNSDGSINLASGSSLTVANELNLGSTFAGFGGTGGQLLVTGILDLGAGPPVDLSSLQSLNVNAGAVNNIAGATLPGAVNLSGGAALNGTGSLLIPSSTTMNVNGASLVSSGSGLNVTNEGAINVAAGQSLSLINASLAVSSTPTGSLSGAGTLSVATGSTLTFGGTVDIAQIDLLGGTLIADNYTYDGDLLWSFGTVDETVDGAGGLTTTGNVTLESGTLRTNWTIATGGTVIWTGDGFSTFDIIDAIITNQGTFTIQNAPASQALKTSAKNFQTSTGAAFINEGTLVIDSDAFAGLAPADTIVFDLTFDNAGGTIAIKSGTFRIEDGNGNPVDLVLDQAGDSLQGFGVFDGNVINQAGTVSPGRSDLVASVFNTGTLTITGNFIQQVNGELVIKMDSTASGLLHDTLIVQGQLNAGGNVKFAIVNGKTPTELALLIDQSFQPLQFTSLAGKFDGVEIPAGLNFTFSPTGEITITSNSPLLNSIASQIEVLFDNDDLSFTQVVRAMRSIDRGVRTRFGEEDEEGRKRAPRLVCR